MGASPFGVAALPFWGVVLTFLPAWLPLFTVCGCLTASPLWQAPLGMRKGWGLEFHHGLIGSLWVLRCLGCCFGLPVNLCMAFTTWFREPPGLKNPGSSLGAGKDWGPLFLHHLWFLTLSWLLTLTFFAARYRKESYCLPRSSPDFLAPPKPSFP